MHHSFTWFQLIPGYKPGNEHVTGGLIVLLIITILSVFAYRHFRKKEITPSSRFTAATLFELISDMLLGIMRGLLGADAPRYLPLVGGIFTFILFSNLLGLVPGFLPPTDNLNTNLACALVVCALTLFYGIRANGWGFFKHFMAPVPGFGGFMLSFLILPIEFATFFIIRPATLTVRLWGNMVADHIVLDVMGSLTKIIIPTLFFGMGLLVCFLQAFIFALLTIIYISLATAHQEH